MYVLLSFLCQLINLFLQRRKILLQQEPSFPKAPIGGVFRNLKMDSCRTVPHSEDKLAKTHAVETILIDEVTGTKHSIRSKYLFGLDGAKSMVRRWISGGTDGDGEWKGAIQMEGEGSDIVWGN